MGAGFGTWGNMDGNDSAGGYDSNAYGIVGGIDFKVGTSAKLGATVGYAQGDIDFDNYNNSADYSGWNVGLYGRYDLPQFYFQAVGSYGMYDNEVARNINIGAVDGISPHRTLLHPNAGIDFASVGGLAATTGTADSDYSTMSGLLSRWGRPTVTNFHSYPSRINLSTSATLSSRAELSVSDLDVTRNGRTWLHCLAWSGGNKFSRA